MDFVLRLLLIGDKKVGKTSLIARYLDDSFTDSLIDDSIGVAYRESHMERDQRSFVLQLWDAGGSYNARHITPSYYKNAHSILIVYDVTSQRTYDNVKMWMQDVDRYAPEEIEVMLVGNKSDDHQRVVDFDGAKEFADQCGMPLVETSAKTGEGVSAAFDEAISRSLAKRRMVQEARTSRPSIERPPANVPRALCRHCGKSFAAHRGSAHPYEAERDCVLL